MRTALCGARVLVLAGWLLAAGCSLDSADGDFNVVLVVLDTLRADRLSVFGNEAETAPYLAGLASRGVVFDNAFTTTSWTAPATASLFTGLYPSQHGVWTGYRASERMGVALNRIPAEAETLPEMLARMGYRTFGVADNVNIGEEIGFSDGFMRFEKHLYQSAEIVHRVVSGWEDELKSDGKYFLYLHLMDPHSPYHRRQSWIRKGSSDAHLERLRQWGRGDGNRQWVRRNLERYDSEIGYADATLAEIHRALDWDQNTLVIVTADHGEEFYDHDGRSHGVPLYQEVMRVPMIVFFPERFEPRRVTDNVSLVDLVPTVRELVGDREGSMTAGRSLVALAAGSRQQPRPVFGMFRGENAEREIVNELRAVVYENWKYIRSSSPAREELFDLSKDGYEQVNLIDSHPEIARELRRYVAAFESTAPALVRSFATPGARSPELDEHLRALGYLN